MTTTPYSLCPVNTAAAWALKCMHLSIQPSGIEDCISKMAASSQPAILEKYINTHVSSYLHFLSWFLPFFLLAEMKPPSLLKLKTEREYSEAPQREDAWLSRPSLISPISSRQRPNLWTSASDYFSASGLPSEGWLPRSLWSPAAKALSFLSFAEIKHQKNVTVSDT